MNQRNTPPRHHYHQSSAQNHLLPPINTIQKESHTDNINAKLFIASSNNYSNIENIHKNQINSWGYNDYHHCLRWNGQSSEEIKLDYNEALKQLRHSKSWFLRNVYDWDSSEETNFWEVICDNFYEIEMLPSKTRNQIRRSLRDCDIRKISNDELIKEDGYCVYKESFSRYKNITVPPVDRQVWEDGVKKDKIGDFWGVFEKETGKLIAWGRNSIKGDMVSYDTLKAIPEYMNKHYPYFGLIYTMNKEYLGSGEFKYVSDGYRSITEHSQIQPFLEKNFLFRKAYCRVQLFYKPWLAICVKILFPFRNNIPILNVKNLLKFEEMVRLN